MKKKIIVVGGGLAGLMATMKICEAGGEVELFSLCPVKRSHSVCAQGGINAAMNTKGQNDSIDEHYDDTVYGGDFLGDQKAIRGMIEMAPKLIEMFDRMGVTWTRTAEGLLDLRNFGGQKNKRTCFSGATTGQQLLYALDEQVRHWEVKGAVKKFEGWDFLKYIKNAEGECRGIVAQNMTTMAIEAFAADAVIIATGGPGLVFGKSTNSVICTGSAASTVYQQGAYLGNSEFIQIHPTAIPGDDKLRLMSESARGEGGRVWTYRDGKPWYFLEDMYPAYGNLVPRDIASRAIFKVCTEMKLGINGENQVYLDLSHIDSDYLDRKLGGILEIYEEFVGEDPRKVPMRIFPAVHYSMGGIWVDVEHRTNVPGLLASGECDYQYHGANRLGANSLLSAAYSGTVSGPSALRWAKSEQKGAALTAEELKAAKDAEVARFEKLLAMNGTENAYQLHKELGEVMLENVAIVRINENIAKADEKLKELLARWENIGVNDKGRYANQEVIFTRQLRDMIIYARAITVAALLRNESRGAHYKPEFPERDDENYLKTTRVAYAPEGPVIDYIDFDHSIIKPRPRRYDVAKEVKK